MRRHLVAATLFVSLAGCAHTRTIDAVKMLSERASPAPSPTQPGARPVKVVIDFGPALGGAVGQKGSGVETAELRSVAGEQEVEADKARLRAEGKKVSGGILVTRAAEAFAEVLGQHLAARLPGSSASVGGQGDLRVTAKGTWTVIGNGALMSLVITATPSGGPPFTVDGTGAGKIWSMGHLAWLVPLSLLLPPGPLLAYASVRSLWGTAQKHAVPSAINVTAAKLADAIVRWRTGATPVPPPAPAAIRGGPAFSSNTGDWAALDAGLRVGQDGREDVIKRLGPPQMTINGSYPSCSSTQMLLWQRRSGGADEALSIIFDGSGKVCVHKYVRQ
jgi:hypothetical protein